LVLQFPLAFGAAIVAAIAAPLAIDLTVDGRATAERGGTVTIRGTVTCSAETLVALDGEVVESLGRNAMAVGTFATEVPCGTTPTPWAITVASDSGTPFRPGFAFADVRVVGFDPESGIYSSVQTLVSLHLTRSAHAALVP
jgi:hypothetical protein